MSIKSDSVYLISIADKPHTITPGISLFKEDEEGHTHWGFLSYFSLFEERMMTITVSPSPEISKDMRKIIIVDQASKVSYRVDYLSKLIFDSCAKELFGASPPDLEDDESVQNYFKNYRQ